MTVAVIIISKVNLQVDYMQIVRIFAPQLFAFHFQNEKENSFKTILGLWMNHEYVYGFLKENAGDIPKGKNIAQMTNEIMEDGQFLIEAILKIIHSDEPNLDHFFKPLDNNEYRIRELSGRKGRRSVLRLYAIRIESNMYVITGGAIKLPLQHLMEDREHTQKELISLNAARDYLKINGIFDEDSFFEFLNETS